MDTSASRRRLDRDLLTFFAISGAGMAQADLVRDRLLRVNAKFCEMTGRTEAELLEMGVEDLTHPEDWPRNRQGISGLLAGKINEHQGEKRLLRKDGSILWVRVVCMLIRNARGKPLRSCALLEDITAERRAHEDANARLLARIGIEGALREADKRKDEFLAILAHELRNPLSPIRHAVRIAQAPAAEPAQVDWSLQVIDRQVGYMARLLDDLLDVSRIGRGSLELRMERIQLASAVADAVETARPLLESKRHALTVELADEPLWLDADPVRLAEIFANLLTNAAKYTDPHGRIHLQAQRAGADVIVAIRDNGIGINPEMRPWLFEMFSQARSARERSEGGLGIGLALVQGLTRLHGGTVEVSSAGVGQGSEFTVRLPLASIESAQRAPAMPDAPRSGKGPPLRVLIADDNLDSAESLAILLQLEGHEVRLASNGREAVSLATQFGPDVALLDIGMPEMSGYEAAAQIRAQLDGQSMMLVAITGWGQEQDKQYAARAGFDHHLTKPIDLAELAGCFAQQQHRRSDHGG
jgi:PAS domain S-box-containing protein